LWYKANAIPSLDLRFAENKSLVDATTGSNLVTFTRASSGTFVDSAGVIQTASTDVPRFDHNPTTGESLGLLVEEQRTNSIRNNTGVGAVAGTPGTLPTNWSGTLTANGLTGSVTGTGTENGVNYIDFSVTGTTTAAGASLVQFDSAIGATASQAWALSSYARIAAGSFPGSGVNLSLAIRENDSGSVFLRQSITSISAATSQLARIALVVTTGASTAFVLPCLRIATTSSPTAVSFTIRIGLPQLELGAFATSPIPTTTATVTRSADVCSISGSNFSAWYRQDEGTLYGDFNPKSGGGAFGFDDTTSNERIRLGHNGTTTAQFVVVDGNTVQCGLATPASSFPLSATGRVAAAYAVNDFALYANTIAATPDTSGTLPIATQATIGNAQASSSINGTIRRLVFWPRRLPDSTLQTVTQ
jgi:hypothetical protein